MAPIPMTDGRKPLRDGISKPSAAQGASKTRFPVAPDTWDNPLRAERYSARTSICAGFALHGALAAPDLELRPKTPFYPDLGPKCVSGECRLLPGIHARASCFLQPSLRDRSPEGSVTQRTGVPGKARFWFGMMGWCCQQYISTFVHQPQNRPNPPRRVGEVLYLFRP